MAVKPVTNPTLQDIASRANPDGSVMMNIVEILRQQNEILDDMTWVEGNLPTGYKTSIRTGLPEAVFRKMYGGVPNAKSKTAQITDNTSMLEIYAEIDKALADLNGNNNAFRSTEDRAFIQGLSNQMAQNLFFGNESLNPERFTGFAPRYNSLSAENADNIIDAGGTTNLRSIWLIGWSMDTVHGITPKGSPTGLQMRDLGEDTAPAPDGNGQYQIYRTHYKWDAGLTLRDWRYVVRIANIDKTALTTNAASGPNLPELMFQALELIPEFMSVNAAFYMSRDVRTFFRQQLASAVQNSTLTFEDVGGRRTAMWQETRLRRCDVLSTDETRVVA